MAENRVTIYHNPRCSNSRGALELIRAKGIEPEIIDYLATPPSTTELQTMLAAMGVSARALMREKESVFAELGLNDLALDEATLIAAMCAHPILINRPIVVTPRGTRLCRPPEIVSEILG